MKERWLVRLLVDRDPDTEASPDQWEWPDGTVLSVQLVGVVGGEPGPEPLPTRIVKLEQGGRK